MLKVADIEIRHSNMLAWLLDTNANHGLGGEILKRLAAEYISFADEAVELLMCNCYSFSIRREWHNIDLLLVSSDAKTVIVIENKVYSGEHSDQLNRYKFAIEEYYRGYRHYFLHLTINGDESSKFDIWYSVE